MKNAITNKVAREIIVSVLFEHIAGVTFTGKGADLKLDMMEACAEMLMDSRCTNNLSLDDTMEAASAIGKFFENP